MKKNKLAFKLIDMGLKAETLANLTESQLRLLYYKLNEETVTNIKQSTFDPSNQSDLQKLAQKGIKMDPTTKKVTINNGKGETKKNKVIVDREIEEGKKKTTKKKYNPWAICTTSVGRKDKEKYEKCVMDVKKSIKEGKDPVNLFLEEKIVSLLENHIQPKISKKDFLQMISETETAPAKPKEKQKDKERKGPFVVPKVKPAPKAMDEAETAEPIVKPKTPTTKPKTPFSPKPGVKPAPKAGKKSVPTWLKWDNFGLNF